MRWMADDIRMEFNITIKRCYKDILMHRSVFFYKFKDWNDEILRMPMNEIASIRVRFGFCRIDIHLPREGYIDNHKGTCRIYCKVGLNLRQNARNEIVQLSSDIQLKSAPLV